MDKDKFLLAHLDAREDLEEDTPVAANFRIQLAARALQEAGKSNEEINALVKEVQAELRTVDEEIGDADD